MTFRFALVVLAVLIIVGCSEHPITSSGSFADPIEPKPAFQLISGTDIIIDSLGSYRCLQGGDLLATVCESGWISGWRFVTTECVLTDLPVSFCSPYGTQGAWYGDSVNISVNGIATDTYHDCVSDIYEFDITGDTIVLLIERDGSMVDAQTTER
jgi:hypothetical protein